MVKIQWIIAVLLLMNATARAQQPERESAPGTQTYSFVQLQGGAQYTFAESHAYSTIWGKVSPNAALTIGHFYSPQLGARLQLGGWTSKNKMGYTDYSVSYLNFNVDIMLNLMRLGSNAGRERGLNLYAILGAGYVHGFGDTNVMVASEYDQGLHALRASNSGSVRLGLQTEWKLTPNWYVNLELNANLLRDDFNGQEKYNFNNDIMMNLLAGVSYRFGGKGTATALRMGASEIETLNEQNNALREQVKEMAERNRVLREMVYGTEKTNGAATEMNPMKGLNKGITSTEAGQKGKNVVNAAEVPAVATGNIPNKATAGKPEKNKVINAASDTILIGIVVFRLNKDIIEADQEIVLYNVAQYMMKYRDRQVHVVSYTDRSTSTANRNRMLGESRTSSIVKLMTERYNIPANRFEMENVECDSQPFNETNVWNKVRIYIKKG